MDVDTACVSYVVIFIWMKMKIDEIHSATDLHNPISPRQWVDLAWVSDVVIWMKIDETHSATWTYTTLLVRGQWTMAMAMGGFSTGTGQ